MTRRRWLLALVGLLAYRTAVVVWTEAEMHRIVMESQLRIAETALANAARTLRDDVQAGR